MAKRKVLTKNEYALPKWFWITLIAVVFVVISSIGYFAYWKTGWPSYLQALEQCNGHPPVRASHPILYGESTYSTPADESYVIPGKTQNGEAYFYYCSEDEAIDAGFTKRSD